MSTLNLVILTYNPPPALFSFYGYYIDQRRSGILSHVSGQSYPSIKRIHFGQHKVNAKTYFHEDCYELVVKS